MLGINEWGKLILTRNRSARNSCLNLHRVLNELIGAIKTIKFFAWDDRWICRALESRKHELEWIAKMRGNVVLLTSIWLFAPIFISILSFLVFVQLGNQLTISTACESF